MENNIHFESVLDRLPAKGGVFYIMVPDSIARQFVEGRRPARVRCILNDMVEFQCAIRPKGDGGFYINVGTPLRQQGKFVLGQKLSVRIWKDDSEFGRDMPEELQELLAMDEEGNQLFDQLLPSHKRGIIHYVAGAKSVQVRIDRAIMLINRLKVKS
ncbi:MAG: YdeI/OmpD-associated family protein [Dyadobacter sp.]|uniref:YdeI/OmpD-associated family protein n=1 Tax=Dyadobacter sp. TaxID=1914288 RepID=UPI003263F312